ncbi:MAG: hypothetical protein CM1200mP3_13700 [Chloroflexota bacterium]|nr:MAG: hypothetical protein CM1200mP3_13700 [Chloroflexota bacterium]
MVKKAYTEAGTELHIVSEAQDISIKAIVEALPFGVQATARICSVFW